MNVHHVNSTLTKAIALIQESRLQEMYVGDGGNFDTPDVDPDLGNESTAEAQFSDYVDDVASAIMNQCDVSEEEALQAIVACASKRASEGLMPDMPDMEEDAEVLATWAGAAKTAGFKGMCIDYCSDQG